MFGSAAGIVADNRNIALFHITPVLFIGCYQMPMYLAPAVLGRFCRN